MNNRNQRYQHHQHQPEQPKSCYLCSEQITAIDYKDLALLKKFVSPYGKIMSRRRTGSCAKHQRMIARAVKKARYIALLPHTVK